MLVKDIYIFGNSKTRSTSSTRQIRKTSKTKHTTNKAKKMGNKNCTIGLGQLGDHGRLDWGT